MSSYANRHFTNDGDVTLRDYRHAARAFADGNFALAPRLKFQHHVVFSTLGGSNQQLSLLARTADTPKFAVTTEVANQYNKKNVIMTGITYTPITFKLYDDNSGVARKLWEGYYAYTFGDHGAAKAGLYFKSLGAPMTSYGLENQPIVPFLNYVKVHTFAKRGWSGYTLVNPIIVGWSSDTFDWTSSNPAEHTLTIAYDAVTFDSGSAGPGSPPNFASGSYDLTPSPLQTPSRGRSPAPGVQNGVLNGVEQVFNNVERKTDPSSAFKSPYSAAVANPEAIAQYNNTQTLTRQGRPNETRNLAISNQENARPASSGLGNLSFPVYDKDNEGTRAVQRKLT